MKKRAYCENCFSKTKSKPCPVCGYAKRTGGESSVLPRGTRLAGKYTVGGSVGRGGFGVTYIAYDIKNEKRVAVKEYFPVMLARRGGRSNVIPNGEKSARQFNAGAERFFDEADIVRQFNGNPNIASIYDCFYENNTAYFIMEYLNGITLEDYVKRYGVLNSAQTLYVAEKLAMALIILHSAQVLHRDISPDNVMLCRDGSVKLIDFGAARKFLAEDPFSLTVMMKTGFTPMEQYSKNGKTGAWTDIYSLGTLLYYAMTGKTPENPYQRTEDDSGFSENTVNADSGLWNIIQKAAAVKPSERFKSAEEIKGALAEIAAERCPVAVPNDYDQFKREDPEDEDIGIVSIFERELSAEKAKRRERYAVITAAAAAAVCAAVIIPSALRLPNAAENPYASAISGESEPRVQDGKIELVLDSEYGGHFNPAGHIPSSYLKSLNSDVKITLSYSANPDMAPDDISGFIPVNGERKSVLKYMTSLPGCQADENGFIFVSPEYPSYSFMLSREGIESLAGELSFEAYNIILNSAELAAAKKPLNYFNYYIRDYSGRNVPVSVAEDNGKKTVVSEFGNQTQNKWGALETGSIPKSAFYEFDGDVKVTLEIEHLSAADDWQVIYVRNSGFCCNVFDDDLLVPDMRGNSGNALVHRDGHFGITPDVSCGECVFIIPNGIKDKMSGGIFFQSVNAAVNSAKLEAYNGEYDSFAKEDRL